MRVNKETEIVLISQERKFKENPYKLERKSCTRISLN